ncbi:hypothetical protein C8Q80DRAFT_1113892 [Daedaleopsis nitida]|nr:hypothetical protein C8Q80DRAFT_1113892 [Daedaleopsis nitida]
MSALDVSEAGAGVLLCLYLSLTSDILPRAQSVPGGSAFCIEWPRYLISLLSRKNAPPAHDWPSTVVNVKSGYARTNRSSTLEHLLQSHSDQPGRRGLTVTFLYTSKFPGHPKADGLRLGALAVALVQIGLSEAMYACGVASRMTFFVTVAGATLSFLGDWIMQRQKRIELSTARAVGPNTRDVVLITSGNGSSDAVVVVTEQGGAKIEDIAGGRASGLDAVSAAAVAVLLALWSALFAAFVRLDVADALCVLGLAVLGTAHAMCAARTWRGAAALGFEFAEGCTTVVHEEKVMQALMRAEEIESGVGLALLPVFFPGPLRPKEEEWWDARKGAAKSV